MGNLEKEGREGKDTRSFPPFSLFMWERVSIRVCDRLVPGNKARKRRMNYDSFTRPSMDDVTWEVHFQCSSPLREIAVGIRL